MENLINGFVGEQAKYWEMSHEVSVSWPRYYFARQPRLEDYNGGRQIAIVAMK